jgi:hypothetical protein
MLKEKYKSNDKTETMNEYKKENTSGKTKLNLEH